MIFSLSTYQNITLNCPSFIGKALQKIHWKIIQINGKDLQCLEKLLKAIFPKKKKEKKNKKDYPEK